MNHQLYQENKPFQFSTGVSSGPGRDWEWREVYEGEGVPAPNINWCQMRQTIAQIARAEETRWTQPNGNKFGNMPQAANFGIVLAHRAWFHYRRCGLRPPPSSAMMPELGVPHSSALVCILLVFARFMDLSLGKGI